ncbi:MAG: thioesterase family protein [Myxococcota bacterium]
MFTYRRGVRFEEVDAAGIVFFGNHPRFAHEAMEAFFGTLDGGYAALINERRLGLPSVALEVQYHAPLRYGDTLTIEVACARLGQRSADLTYRMVRVAGDSLIATVRQTVVMSNLDVMESVDMPADVRAALAAHLISP